MRRKGVFLRISILIIMLFGVILCGWEEAISQKEKSQVVEIREAKIQETEARTLEAHKTDAQKIMAQIIEEQEAKVQETKEQETEMQEAEVQETVVAEEPAPAVREIPIDFPFDETEPYLLALALLKTPAGEYELRLYDEAGRLLQHVSCGALTEPIQFSYDSVYGGIWKDLAIFSAGSDTGLLFEYGYPDDRFSENAIEIPKFTEKQDYVLLNVEEEHSCQTKKLYQIDNQMEYVYEVRCWKLHKDTGELIIWDDIEEKNLFEGIVELDEKGNPVNEEYYDMLFRDDLNWLSNYERETSVQTWIEGDNHYKEYESREALLADFGFQDSAPMYQYFDRYGNLQLELYHDPSSDQFCGIIYQFYFDSNKNKKVEMLAFVTSCDREAKWVEEDPFSTKAVDGSNPADYVREPEEIVEYTPSGRLDYYCCQGWTEQERDRELTDVLCAAVEINYIYRDDGTLFYRDYSHEPRMFSTTYSYLHSFYDENERIIFESGYITHGELQHYYIYEDEGRTPKYYLSLDYAGGYVSPWIVKYY